MVFRSRRSRRAPIHPTTLPGWAGAKIIMHAIMCEMRTLSAKMKMKMKMTHKN